ncbi:MAG: FAD-binding oxidoreductase, partial [Chloroflexota bacterium]
MTDLAADVRAIDPAAPQYNATLVRREDQHESLARFWVRFDAEPTPFVSGQYMTIGVFADGKLVQRPYSVASDPAVAGDEGYEMYVRLVNGGTFTPLLWRLPVGHRMRMIGPKGKFTLLPDDDRTHIFISSGTGNAPFVSMIRALLREGRPRRTVFLNGVSYARDLGYDSLVRGWEMSGEYPVAFVPTVSRPDHPDNADWTGRTGRVEMILGPVLDEMGLTAANSIAYICG